MSATYLSLTPHDAIVARDGRPFGINQGQRMRGLPWPLPSVVAGSFRTALVKAGVDLDFSGDMPQRLMQVAVAGVFPVHDGNLYLPAPNDAVAEPIERGKGIKTIHRVTRQPNGGGCDFPNDLPLQPVMLPDGIDDFKPAEMPAWWPLGKFTEWLTEFKVEYEPAWFDNQFLKHPDQEIRDHVCLDADRGAAAEGMIYATSGLNVTHLPRFGVDLDDPKLSFEQRYAQVILSARVELGDAELQKVKLNHWHPLGGERRLVHWSQDGEASWWSCPNRVKDSLDNAKQIRMLLATPAIFKDGWKPGWLDQTSDDGKPMGKPFKDGPLLELVGVSNGRWKAVSGWSLAPPRGPKAIRRMVPAGGVYFFEVKEGNASDLTQHWLQSVSDDEQEQRDGFGLALWGTWYK